MYTSSPLKRTRTLTPSSSPPSQTETLSRARVLTPPAGPSLAYKLGSSPHLGGSLPRSHLSQLSHPPCSTHLLLCETAPIPPSSAPALRAVYTADIYSCANLCGSHGFILMIQRLYSLSRARTVATVTSMHT